MSHPAFVSNPQNFFNPGKGAASQELPSRSYWEPHPPPTGQQGLPITPRRDQRSPPSVGTLGNQPQVRKSSPSFVPATT